MDFWTVFSRGPGLPGWPVVIAGLLLHAVVLAGPGGLDAFLPV